MNENPSPKKLVSMSVWGGLVLVLLLIVGAYILDGLNQSRSERAQSRLMVISQVTDFQLTNQLGQPITRENYADKIWVADIIFTRCPGPCVYMTQRMKELQDFLPADWPVQFVSLTTDPEYDSPSVLNDYARRFGADASRWDFLTGPKPEIVSLAVDDLKLVLREKAAEDRESPDDLFIHSTLLVLVDQQGRLRAAFESLPRLDNEEDLTEDEIKAILDKAFDETKANIRRAIRQLMDENEA